MELSNPSGHAFLLLGVTILVVASFVYKTYLVFTNRLAHLPGPIVSRWTNLRLKAAVVTGERLHYVHSLHERYGPVVRISPSEVSLAHVSAVKTIYRVGSPFLKSTWYLNFTGQHQYQNIFTMIDTHKHGNHRRLMAYNFSEKWISNMEPFIVKNVQLAIARMSDEVKAQGYFDALKWFTFMATDVIGEASFGESFRMLETGKKNQYIYDLERVGQRGAMRAEFPLLSVIMAYMPFGFAKEVNRSVDRLIGYAEESLERYWRQLKAEPDNAKPTLLTKVYDALEDGSVEFGQLRRDATGNITAGTDTTAFTATYAVWLLSHHPELEQSLIREVAALQEDFKDEDLRQLKFLDNVIHETLRLRGPVSQSLPRIVPAGGTEICGHFIPAGETVGVQAWTMHRDPSIWPHPEIFDPSRWDNASKDMLHSFLAFGGGSRVCIGSHFAKLELRHALANFYRTFESGVKISSAEGFSSADMEPVSYFLLPPKGKRCLLERRK